MLQYSLVSRSIANFFIFAAADALSQSISARSERRRRRRRRKRQAIESIVDLSNSLNDDELIDLDAAASSSSSDHARSLRFALFGALVHAPACSLFFGSLDARFPGRSWREVSLKLAADRATLAPALLLVALLWMRLPVSVLFFPEQEGSSSSNSTSSAAASACLETLYEQGRKPNNKDTTKNSKKWDLVATATDDALHRLPRAFALSCLFWVPAHSLGFATVTARWRVLYVALASLVWNCVLAGISSAEPTAAVVAARKERRATATTAGPSASSSSLPLFAKRQTRKARLSDLD